MAATKKARTRRRARAAWTGMEAALPLIARLGITTSLSLRRLEPGCARLMVFGALVALMADVAEIVPRGLLDHPPAVPDLAKPPRRSTRARPHARRQRT